MEWRKAKAKESNYNYIQIYLFVSEYCCDIYDMNEDMI